MLMEYLGPIVDGCRSALSVSVEKARQLHKMSEDEFEELMHSKEGSFSNISFCFKTSDTDDEYSIVFDGGLTKVYDECIEPDVVISSDFETLVDLLDSDARISPPELLRGRLQVVGAEPMEIVEALGFLCYPSLLRMARSGVDPSSLLSEDADAVIIAAASDMVTRMVREWIDISFQRKE
jgi:putative sterol carrier protein